MADVTFTEVKQKAPKQKGVYIPKTKDPQTKDQSVLQKHGNDLVVTAQLKMLFTFVLRQLVFLSVRHEEDYREIVAWAKKNLEEVSERRNQIVARIIEAGTKHPTSATADVLGCKKNEDGTIFSTWYHIYNNAVPAAIKEKYPFKLGDERYNLNHVVCLLDQVCLRLDKIANWYKGKRIGAFDLEVREEMNQHWYFFYGLMNEADGYNLMMEELHQKKMEERAAAGEDEKPILDDPRTPARTTNRFALLQEAPGAPKKDKQQKKARDRKKSMSPRALVFTPPVVGEVIAAEPATGPSRIVEGKGSWAAIASVATAARVPSAALTWDEDEPVDDPNAAVVQTKPVIIEAEKAALPAPVCVPTIPGDVPVKNNKRQQKKLMKKTEANNDDGVIDLAEEVPSQAAELKVVKAPSPPSTPVASGSASDMGLVWVPMATMVNGEMAMTKVLMKKSDLAAVRILDSA